MAKIDTFQSANDAGWKRVTLAAGESAATVGLPVGPLLVPVEVWRARRRELVERQYEHGSPLGVWLGADEGPELIAADIDDFNVIGIEAEEPASARTESTEHSLRTRYAFTGELRRVAVLSRDQRSTMRRVA